ncbi:NAD(P)/FAD-dependent oxidoreductase [Pararhizobium gei]|uniref:NAD(P)/FAD-dependent oxidoreductase n=1 Tax=Pararhizobium gei TaxID=1395951 RepID=UPI0023DAE0F9|nr:FAD-dependent oxidoreductase [Rhizobium gei]
MNAHFTNNPKDLPGRRLSVAIIGSGVSGSSAAWALNSLHDVTLYEKADRPGGHTATVDIDYDGVPVSVDTGFIVYNEPNYPNLTSLLAELDVATHPSDMSFSVSLDHGRLEWSGDNLATVFAQKRNLLRPSFLLMLKEILRFNRLCLADRSAGRLADMSIGDYLDWRGFSPGFTNNYLTPMAAAIWSSPTAKMLDFPAERFIQFFENHRLVHRTPHPWRTVTGGSRNYLEKLLAPLGDRLKLGCGVHSVIRQDGKVLITDEHRVVRRYDKVIIATHSDQSLAVLTDASPQEKSVLASVPYHPNRVILHRDESLMPQRRKCWASWNYLRSAKPCGATGVAVTYWMNRLQGIPARMPLFVTLNPEREPHPSKVFAEFSYDHPMFDTASLAAQHRLQSLQGLNGTYFAGAWTGYGFHEDGLSSGLAAAEALGGIVPWRSPATVPFKEAAE